MTELIAKRCFIRGRVQGVFFRGSTAQQAAALGVRGYARNLKDGRVEVLAVGEGEAVQTLVQWLWQGPPSARVMDVSVEDVAVTELGSLPSTFETR